MRRKHNSKSVSHDATEGTDNRTLEDPISRLWHGLREYLEGMGWTV